MFTFRQFPRKLFNFLQFGRKKKKYRGSVDAAPSRPAPPPAPVEDDDDEEEDSDDDDLGAYAFDSDVSFLSIPHSQSINYLRLIRSTNYLKLAPYRQFSEL